MARPRTELSLIFKHILQRDNVYFQPPTGLQMKYPCIVYERSNYETTKADNKIYRGLIKYTVTVMHKDPDNEIYKKILDSFSYGYYDRSFKSDNFNHDVLTIYY